MTLGVRGVRGFLGPFRYEALAPALRVAFVALHAFKVRLAVAPDMCVVNEAARATHRADTTPAFSTGRV